MFTFDRFGLFFVPIVQSLRSSCVMLLWSSSFSLLRVHLVTWHQNNFILGCWLSVFQVWGIPSSAGAEVSCFAGRHWIPIMYTWPCTLNFSSFGSETLIMWMFLPRVVALSVYIEDSEKPWNELFSFPLGIAGVLLEELAVLAMTLTVQNWSVTQITLHPLRHCDKGKHWIPVLSRSLDCRV